MTKTIGRGARALVLALLAGAVMAGCTKTSERVTFNGVYYKAKAKAVSRNDRERFIVTVPRVNRGYDGALAAGNYEGKRYCVANYGTSEIAWSRPPSGARGTIPVKNNKMTFAGRCVLW
ncbi:MAG: hypothetical protein ACE369_09285 [Roseovarius sp.]